MKNLIQLLLILLVMSNYSAQNIIHPEKFEQGGKYGLKDGDRILLPAVYDWISTNILIITSNKNEKNIYDQKLSLLYKDSEFRTYSFYEDSDILQILLKNNKIVSYNWDGILTGDLKFKKHKEAKKIVDSASEIYTIKKGKVQKTHNNIFESPEDNLTIINYDLKGKDAKFLNNRTSLEIEYSLKSKNKSDSKLINYEYNDEILFSPLKVSYVISKLANKYGIWDFKNEKIIIPFEYDKIVSHQNYVYLEKNNLSTFYPNIGLTPKYKKLEPYNGAFARFETIDGRKGWIDRDNKEFFD